MPPTSINLPGNVGAVIRVGDDCYQFAGFSSGAPDVSSADAVFGTCEDCAQPSTQSSGTDISTPAESSAIPGDSSTVPGASSAAGCPSCPGPSGCGPCQPTYAALGITMTKGMSPLCSYDGLSGGIHVQIYGCSSDSWGLQAADAGLGYDGTYAMDKDSATENCCPPGTYAQTSCLIGPCPASITVT